MACGNCSSSINLLIDASGIQLIVIHDKLHMRRENFRPINSFMHLYSATVPRMAAVRSFPRAAAAAARQTTAAQSFLLDGGAKLINTAKGKHTPMGFNKPPSLAQPPAAAAASLAERELRPIKVASAPPTTPASNKDTLLNGGRMV